MNVHKLFSALHKWRARSSAILPLAFLQALAVGLGGLPATYLFRAIRCEEYRKTLPPHVPEDDICRSAIVQKAYSTDIAIYTTVLAVLSIVLSGPYGRVSDIHGRKRALTIAVALNAFGDTWFVLCSLFAPLRTSWFLQLAAVLQGLGGGFSVVMAGQNAFIADTSAPSKRSYYMGLSLVMWWVGNTVGPLISAVLLDEGLYTINFGIIVVIWALYLSYLLFAVREVHVPLAEESACAAAALGENAAHRSAVSRLLAAMISVVEPIIILGQHISLLLVSIAMAGTVLAIGVFNLIIPYCDTKFGMEPSEAGLLTAVWSVARAITVTFLFPMFLAAYQWLTNRNQSTEEPTSIHDTVPTDETTPLLAEATHEPQASESTPPAEATSISQEIIVVRICLLLDALGMLAIERSRNVGEAIFATAMSSLSAPAGPSMQALVTLAAPPGEIGRVLAGLSILQSAAVALRGPVFVPLFNATLEKAPGAIWWLSALMLTLCSLVAFALRPRQFVYAHGGHT
ncbi:uncharacterized protein PHACADRAFT_265378 [Phanerochaete carnosa HHB-10118-sp]|uniref:Major facilitator superfamily (MFS) profile domain-containing protein n=1 Tax=Phanerochaete carnosa (strain HHB-10118-sp) TaxID=650164 RepID=K5VEZ1_PHACS|nr:uncharacterized protein PHACADRAFT_265378 [Phanerochaete carnosa HHB-10118-sp]EKM49728.1 hypothetical protein PHACADRAFT_265378 [Phanerochaete carnosa HHB-10118-sp]